MVDSEQSKVQSAVAISIFPSVRSAAGAAEYSASLIRCMFVGIVEGSPCAGLSPRHRRLQSEVLYERIEILVAVKQCQSLLNAACRDQCVDGFSDGDAK